MFGANKTGVTYVSKVGMTNTDNQDGKWSLAALADGLDSLIPVNEPSRMLAENQSRTISIISV